MVGHPVLFCNLTTRECTDDHLQRVLFAVGAVLSGVDLLYAVALLAYRLRFRRKTALWRGGLFAPLEGFLIWIAVGCVFQCAESIARANSWFASRMILRENLWASSSWAFAVAGYNYLAAVLAAILRMNFDRPTSTPAMSKGGRGTAAAHTVWFPIGARANVIYWPAVIFSTVCTFTGATLTGYFSQKGDLAATRAALTFRAGTSTAQYIMLFAGFMYYGRRMVRLTVESFALCDAAEVRPAPRRHASCEMEWRRHKAHIRKLQIFNYVLGAIYLWWSVSWVVLSVGYDYIVTGGTWTNAYIAVESVLLPVCVLAVSIGITLGERTPLRDHRASGSWASFARTDTPLSTPDAEWPPTRGPGTPASIVRAPAPAVLTSRPHVPSFTHHLVGIETATPRAEQGADDYFSLVTDQDSHARPSPKDSPALVVGLPGGTPMRD